MADDALHTREAIVKFFRGQKDVVLPGLPYQRFQVFRQAISVIEKNRRAVVQFDDRNHGAVDRDLGALLQRDEITSRGGDRAPHPVDDRSDHAEPIVRCRRFLCGRFCVELFRCAKGGLQRVRRGGRKGEARGQAEGLAGREPVQIIDLRIQFANETIGREGFRWFQVQFGQDDPADGIPFPDPVG